MSAVQGDFQKIKGIDPSLRIGRMSGSCAPFFLAIHALADQFPSLVYNGKGTHAQPNKSFKLTSLRGADFGGSVYHNAAPLRSAT